MVPEARAPVPRSVFFATDKSEITPSGSVVLKNQAEWLQQHPNARVEIAGNADARAGEEYNQKLAQERADAVKGHLVGLGVNPDRMMTASHGKDKPVCGESTEACYAANRRVDLSVIG
jgi:peptidoglycan-associated lipoprotein